MASIRNIARWYNDEIQDGICWVAVWKNGRSWDAEAFWVEDGDYDDGFIFSREDMERMEEILMIDRRAVMLNGYYCNCGTVEDERVSIENIVRGIEWNYYNGYNLLFGFYDGMVIKPTEQAPAVVETVKEPAEETKASDTKEVRYTETQKEIIKKREALEYMFYASTKGLCDVIPATLEAATNNLLAWMVDDCNKRRKSQQEAFDKMPWLANMCGRV